MIGGDGTGRRSMRSNHHSAAEMRDLQHRLSRQLISSLHSVFRMRAIGWWCGETRCRGCRGAICILGIAYTFIYPATPICHCRHLTSKDVPESQTLLLNVLAYAALKNIRISTSSAFDMIVRKKHSYCCMFLNSLGPLCPVRIQRDVNRKVRSAG
jgi:hypothetical protein